MENIDVLKFFPDFKTKKFTKYIIIANIPYYITSPILRHFLYDAKNKPEQMVILIQKDVGDRILNNNK
ncbi:MAG: hypothetical protein LBU14_04990 [Candidatus Peribacteria bacterium]|nr:hypothetical protein [Candidatus Peribacteria bacterium]